MTTRPVVSVVLVSWNTHDATARCLRSLHDTAGEVPYELIAVDNGSADGSVDVLTADARVRLVRNDHNVGFAAAVNQGYALARGEMVMLLNSDVVLHPGALATMVRFLHDSPDAAGVSPLYLNPDGTFQQHYVQFPSLMACIAMWTALKRLPAFRRAKERFEMLGQDFSQRRELASASCVLIRHDALGERIFDERFPLYWNDAVLSRELADRGQRMWMIPEAVVTHARGASCARLGPATRSRHLLGGLVNYLRETESRARVELFRAVVVADYFAKTAAGRTTTLGWGDLTAAFRGDVGPLPDGVPRDWVVCAGAVESAVSDGRRLLVVDGSGSQSGGFTVARVDDGVWTATLPVPVRIGKRWPLVRWVNGRVGAAGLRRWLDRQSGDRMLVVDHEHEFLAGRLGDNVPVVLT